MHFFPELRWKSKISNLFSQSEVQKTIQNIPFFDQSVIKVYLYESIAVYPSLYIEVFVL